MTRQTHTDKGLQRERRIHNPLSRSPEKRLYTLKEAAIYLGRPEYSVRELVWSGVLPFVRADEGRKYYFDKKDLDEYIDRNKRYDS